MTATKKYEYNTDYTVKLTDGTITSIIDQFTLNEVINDSATPTITTNKNIYGE